MKPVMLDAGLVARMECVVITAKQLAKHDVYDVWNDHRDKLPACVELEHLLEALKDLDEYKHTP